MSRILFEFRCSMMNQICEELRACPQAISDYWKRWWKGGPFTDEAIASLEDARKVFKAYPNLLYCSQVNNPDNFNYSWEQ